MTLFYKWNVRGGYLIFPISDLLFSGNYFHLCFLLFHCTFKNKVSIFASFSPLIIDELKKKKDTTEFPQLIILTYFFYCLCHASPWGWIVYRGINYREKLQWQSKFCGLIISQAQLGKWDTPSRHGSLYHEHYWKRERKSKERGKMRRRKSGDSCA